MDDDLIIRVDAVYLDRHYQVRRIIARDWPVAAAVFEVIEPRMICW